MTTFLKIILGIQIIAYLIYIVTAFINTARLPFQLNLTIFLSVTFSFIFSFVILSTLIELREVVLDNREKASRQPLFSQDQSTSKVDIELAKRVIEENNYWNCSCGIKNPAGASSCPSCGKNKQR
jgi:hypothetical protein